MEDKAGDHWVKVLESAKIAVQFKRLPLSYRISGATPPPGCFGCYLVMLSH